MLDGVDKSKLAQEGAEYLVEQNILMKNRLAQLIAENSMLKDKVKTVTKAIKEMLAQSKKINIS